MKCRVCCSELNIPFKLRDIKHYLVWKWGYGMCSICSAMALDALEDPKYQWSKIIYQVSNKEGYYYES